MPYISDLCRRVELFSGDIAQNAAELNCQIFHYLISEEAQNAHIDKVLILSYVTQFLGKTPNYQKYNDLMGCLICCYKEVKRRTGTKIKFLFEIIDMYDVQIGKYEDTKIKTNGDIGYL